MQKKFIIGGIIFIAIVGASALLGAFAGGWAVFQAVSRNQPAQVPISNEPLAPISSELYVASTDVETAVTRAVEQVGPAVVTVVSRYANGAGSGSGVIISSDGYIITNNHVVENAVEVAVLLADGTELSAEVIGTEAFADLAVVRAEGVMPAVAPLGDSNLLNAGETVIAIGSPSGRFCQHGYRGRRQPQRSRPPIPDRLRNGRPHPDRCRHQQWQLRRSAGQPRW